MLWERPSDACVRAVSDWLALPGAGALDALYLASGTAGIASHAPLAKVLSAPPSVTITNLKVHHCVVNLRLQRKGWRVGIAVFLDRIASRGQNFLGRSAIAMEGERKASCIQV